MVCICLPAERVVPETFIVGVIEVDVIAAVTTIIEAVCWFEFDDDDDRPTTSFVSVMLDCWLEI